MTLISPALPMATLPTVAAGCAIHSPSRWSHRDHQQCHAHCGNWFFTYHFGPRAAQGFSTSSLVGSFSGRACWLFAT
jgi:hypothetical protein